MTIPDDRPAAGAAIPEPVSDISADKWLHAESGRLLRRLLRWLWIVLLAGAALALYGALYRRSVWQLWLMVGVLLADSVVIAAASAGVRRQRVQRSAVLVLAAITTTAAVMALLFPDLLIGYGTIGLLATLMAGVFLSRRVAYLLAAGLILMLGPVLWMAHGELSRLTYEIPHMVGDLLGAFLLTITILLSSYLVILNRQSTRRALRQLILSNRQLVQEIAQRQLFEAALRRSEQDYRGLIENARDAILIIDPAAETVLAANRRATALYGQEPAGRPLAQLDLPADCLQELRQAAGAGETGRRFEITLPRPQAPAVALDVQASPVSYAGRPAVLSVQRDVTEQKQIAAELRAALLEKEVLLKEIHHRVKNNLQIISSLLKLQAGYASDPTAQAVFAESQGRIRSMAHIHELLYRSSDLARIPFDAYLRDLAGFAQSGYYRADRPVRLDLDLAPCTLDLEMAVPCGLVANELISNAFRHAFPAPVPGRQPCIAVTFRADDGRLLLAVADNGVGLPAELDWRDSDTLGLELVRLLVEQMRGELVVERQSGTRFMIQCPLQVR